MDRRQFLQTAAALPLAASLPSAGPASTPPPWHPFHSREGIRSVVARRQILHGLPWDFNLASGCTVKEKFESLTGIVEAAIHLSDAYSDHMDWPGYPHFSLLTGPELASVFEVAASNFEPASSHECRINDFITLCGRTLRPAVEVYKDALFPTNLLIVRADKAISAAEERNSCYVRIEVCNFLS